MPPKTERLERHSGSGTRGTSKKDGHAAKGGWGKAGTGEDGTAIVDSKDPNYVSDDEDENLAVLSKKDLSSHIEVILKEYFSLGDVDETAKTLQVLNQTNEHPHFVKKALYMALDKQAYERELISRLLSSLYSRVISRKDIEEGFQQALDNLDDVSLDSPEAPDVISKFLARAVVDEILSPSFLTQKTKAPLKSTKAGHVLSVATALATQNHGGERLAHIWGPGDLLSVKRLKEEVKLLLGEYLHNSDNGEAEKSVRRFNAPTFHFQIVKSALRLGIEKGPSERVKLSSLLKYFFEVALISSTHMDQGFKQTVDGIDDLKLDVPNAPTLLSEMITLAKSEKYLSEDFTPSRPL